MYKSSNLRQRVTPRSPALSGGCIRIGLALVLVAIAVVSFLGSKQAARPHRGEFRRYHRRCPFHDFLDAA